MNKFIPTPIAALISMVDDCAASATPDLHGYGGYGQLCQPSAVSPSPHYTGSSFADVFGINHQQLVDEAVTQKASGPNTLH